MRSLARVLPIASLAVFSYSPFTWAANPYPPDTGLVKIHFGDLPEELKTAGAEGKIFAIYFWQEGCPYCDKLEKKIFSRPAVRKVIEDDYYMVEVNIFGAKEIKSLDGKAMSEKEFAESHDIQFTPTIVFFDQSGKTLFRMIGAWEEDHFLAAASYVKDGHYSKSTFEEFFAFVWPKYKAGKGAPRADVDPYSTGLVARRSADLRAELGAARGSGKLLMIYFWRDGSPYCELFEKEILTRGKLRKAIEDNYRLIEVNVFGEEPIIGLDGVGTDEKSLASAMGVSEAPTIVFVGEDGSPVFTMPAVWKKSTHFEAATHYVKEGRYRESSFQEFIRYVWFKPEDQQGE